jgi:hypothetical protein
MVLVQCANHSRTKVCAAVSLRQPGLLPRPVACVSGENRPLRHHIGFLPLMNEFDAGDRDGRMSEPFEP